MPNIPWSDPDLVVVIEHQRRIPGDQEDFEDPPGIFDDSSDDPLDQVVPPLENPLDEPA